VSARFPSPGFWTLAVHFMTLAVLAVCLLPVLLLRIVVAPAAEGLIRASDGLHDALVERLEL
jgi:hypothetical protein